MEKYSKLSLIIFLTISAIVTIYALIAIYIQDPLQVWHKPFFNKKYNYSWSIRESARAMIRDLNFDSIIIGNSYSENTSCKKAEKIFGGKFINLSISGSTPYEKKIILDYALKRKKIKKVIYVIDGYYEDLSINPHLYDINNYNFLYNENIFDDFKIYLNDKFFERILFFHKPEKHVGQERDMDKPYAWEGKIDHYQRFGGFDNWLKYKDNQQLQYYFNTISKTPLELNKKELSKEYKKDLAKYLNKYILSTVAKHPNVEFYVIISPVCEIELARMIRCEKQAFEKYKEMLKIMTFEKEKYDNLKIYAFNDNKNFSKIEDFKDESHYRSKINYQILEAIVNNNQQINYNNLDNYIEKTYYNAIEFDFEKYQTIIKKAQM